MFTGIVQAVGRVASVTPEWRTNAFGDRLIVSILQISIDETLKGQRDSTLDVEVRADASAT